jgi:hypothetical protein
MFFFSERPSLTVEIQYEQGGRCKHASDKMFKMTELSVAECNLCQLSLDSPDACIGMNAYCKLCTAFTRFWVEGFRYL